ncbi:MAG: hypothetical protein WB853_06600 [Desulfobacterales bacterium]
MKDQQQHETRENAYVHRPSQKALFKYPPLKDDIQNKNLEQSEKPGTEQNPQGSPHCCLDPLGRGYVRGRRIDSVAEPRGNLIQDADAKYG